MTSASGIALGPLSLLYGIAIRTRLALYRKGALAVNKIDAPVISVGNITTGGTGKTPLVEWLARLFAEEKRRPCILTRGYGRANKTARVLVSNGERVLADAVEGGDEPRLLAEKLLGLAAVISDADRTAAARWAIQNLHSDIFILDDGFQHLRLERDLNILTIDATNPWGGGRLLPYGRLREPLHEMARADCCVIMRTEQVTGVDSLREEVKERCGGRPAFLSTTRTVGLRQLTSLPAVALDASSTTALLTVSEAPKNVAAFGALGNTRAFFAHLLADGFKLKHTRAFRDHHAYTQSEIENFSREAQARGAEALLTTAKDGVKLRALKFQLPCYVVEIKLEFDDEAALRRIALETLST
jgi:tetraacyldisaccharide 4'-kinase